MKTPKPRMTQLSRQITADQAYPAGSSGDTSHIEKSVSMPKTKTTGIWSRWTGRNCLLSRAACTATKLRCMRMVMVPMLRGRARLRI